MAAIAQNGRLMKKWVREQVYQKIKNKIRDKSDLRPNKFW